MTKASVVTIEGAAHFMLPTHAREVARLIAHEIPLDQAIRRLMSRPLKEE